MRWPRPLALLIFVSIMISTAFTFRAEARSNCPKLLMYTGASVDSQSDDSFADYWGKKIGIQGFFLDRLMPTWLVPIGADSGSPVWQKARTFERIYSAAGATDNFVTVTVPAFDWSSAENNAAIENFTNAAAMARYAGMKGIALDLEPYRPVWTYAVSDVDDLALQSIVYQVASTIGTEMRQAYPSMTLVLVKDVLNPRITNSEKYGLASIFLKGLLSAGFAHVVIAGEQTYDDSDIAGAVAQIKDEYKRFMRDNGLPPTDVTVAPGLWPLGRSFSDKSPRMSPQKFEQELQAAFAVAPKYVWIWGYGSAWQTNGPFGKGPVTSNFKAYVDAIHHVEQSCQAGKVETASIGTEEAPADPPSGGGGGLALPSLFSLLGLVLIAVRARQRRG